MRISPSHDSPKQRRSLNPAMSLGSDLHHAGGPVLGALGRDTLERAETPNLRPQTYGHLRSRQYTLL